MDIALISLDTPSQKLAEAMCGFLRGSVKNLKPADPRVGTDSLSLSSVQAGGEHTAVEVMIEVIASILTADTMNIAKLTTTTLLFAVI